MAFFSLLAVLLLEHIGPLPYRLIIRDPVSRYAGFIESRLNGGERSHGLLAWLVAVVVPVAASAGVYAACYAFSPLLAWIWNVLALYLTMGFRQSALVYGDIEFALRMDDLPRARELLTEWRGSRSAGGDLTSSEIARLAIEEMLVQAHRHVFAVLFCFVLLPGPCGAVFYRLTSALAEAWGRQPGNETDLGIERFGRFSQQAFAFIDRLSSRVTAAGFAVAGNFEAAVYCWRTRAAKCSDQDDGKSMGVVLSSGSGAIGVRLGSSGDEAGAGREADPDAMQSANGLVLRALFLWLLLLLLIGFTSLIGA